MTDPRLHFGEILLDGSGDWTIDDACCCDPPYCFCILPIPYETACDRCYAIPYDHTSVLYRRKIAKVICSGAVNPTVPNNPYPLGSYSMDAPPWHQGNTQCGPRDAEHADYFNRNVYFDLCNNGYPYAYGQYNSAECFALCGGTGCGPWQPDIAGNYPCRIGDPNICSVLPVLPGIYTPYLQNIIVNERCEIWVSAVLSGGAWVFDPLAGPYGMWLIYDKIVISATAWDCIGMTFDLPTCPPGGVTSPAAPCTGYCGYMSRGYNNGGAYTTKRRQITKTYLMPPSLQWRFYEHSVGDPGTYPFTYCTNDYGCNGIYQANGCWDQFPYASTTTIVDDNLIDPGLELETFLGVDLSSFDINLELI